MTSSLIIREYKDADFQYLVLGMKFLQEHVIKSDNYNLNIMNEGYGEAYAIKTLEKVAENSGKIYCAFLGDVFLGCIVGLIEEAVPLEVKNPLQDYMVGKIGEGKELIVLPESRGLGVGKALMQKMEQYFIDSGCEFSYLEVFGPNKIARDFYEKGGYKERMITLIKPL